MKTIEISYSLEGLDDIANQIKKLIPSKGLYEFIAKKSMQALKEISVRSLSTYDDNSIDLSYYVNNHKYEIIGDKLRIYNDSTIDISNKNMSDEKKQNYPDFELSLAKVVEYGIGYTGSHTDQTDVEDWEYDKNGYGSKGWYYMDDGGNIHWTSGFEGRLIFSQLGNYIIENAGKWIKEYIENKIK